MNKTNSAAAVEEHKKYLIKEQKMAAQYVMEAVRKLPWTRDAIVAGGAPRDWFCGELAKDVGIFLIGTTITQTQLEMEMKRAGFPVQLANLRKNAEEQDPLNMFSDEAQASATYYKNPKIRWVYDGVAYQRSNIYDKALPVKYQIIVTTCEDVAELLATFPVEISKFTWNYLTNAIKGEPGALRDVREKTITQTCFDFKQGRYIKKIQDKFPGHKFISEFFQPQYPATSKVKLAKPLPIPTTPMAAEQFAYWLQGFFEMVNPAAINEQQTRTIRDHLKLVFDKQTPDRNNNYQESPFNGNNNRYVSPGALLPVKTLVSC